MWNLSQTRERLTDRLAEESTVFWGSAERDRAISDAQRFIAAVTRGIPLTITGTVSIAQPFVNVTGRLTGEYATAGWVAGTTLDTLRSVTPEVANTVYPNWPSACGVPRWIIVMPDEQRVYVAPAPVAATSVSIRVAVLPDDLVNDSDVVFNGEQVMEKYQGALLNIAVSLLLLKERYDQDAERFYQFAVQEMQAVGIDPARIPSLPRQVAQDG